MKRFLFYFLFAVIIIAGYAMYAQKDMGLMQVSFAGYHFQATLFEVGVGALAVLLAFLLVSFATEQFKALTETVAEIRTERQEEKARHVLEQGMIELAEGRHARAERLLLQKIEHNEHALLGLLAAAQAAQYQGAYDRRDAYLRQAHIRVPDAAIAIDLTQAKLQMEHNQFEQALVTLNHLKERVPQHPHVLTLLAETLSKRADWSDLREMLPLIQKSGALSSEKLVSLEIDTWCGLISDRADTGDIDKLTRIWDDTPPKIKSRPEVIEHYASALIKLQAAGEAEQILRNYLNNYWVESTVMLYSELDVMASEQQIRTAEGWLKEHQQNQYLLLALAKMCISIANWGKARSYLEASLSVAPMPVTYLKLAQLLEDHMDDRRQAQEYYRQGLHMLAGDYGEQALANAEKDFQRVIMKPELRVI